MSQPEMTQRDAPFVCIRSVLLTDALPTGFRIIVERNGSAVLIDERDDENAYLFADQAAAVEWARIWHKELYGGQ